MTLASKKYPYLSNLDLADFGQSNNNLNVDILIGADYYWSLVTGITKQGSGPTAIETRLGWVLSGPATGMTLKSTSVNLLSCYVLNAGVQSCDTSLDQILQRFWDLEQGRIEGGRGGFGGCNPPSFVPNTFFSHCLLYP